jgi:hypothetical protein
MKKLVILTTASLALALSAFAAPPPYYITGADPILGGVGGWNANANLMTDMGGGIYQSIFSGLTSGGRYEFKVTEGDWSWSAPGPGNSWFYANGSGDITLTYDSNTYADGWSSASGRIGVSVDPGTWTAVGDWQGWNNADPTTAMTSLGSGIYEYETTFASAGTYYYKAVDTGSWDAIGADARGVNADNLGFTTTDPNQLVDFYVNALNGTIQANVVPVPEPASVALIGLGGLALLAFRRRS